MNRPTILLAEDETYQLDGLTANLKAEGFDVVTARNGEEALAKFHATAVDLLVLDVMMPKKNGFCVCEEIRRENPSIPVIFLTALDGEAEQVRALALGADDYINKLTSESILIARIRRALARRAQAAEEDAFIQLGRVTIDRNMLSVTEGKRLVGTLTRTEFAVLMTLLKNRGRTLSADEVVNSVRGAGIACCANLVSAHVSKLKKKLGTAAALILNVRGVGYLLIK